MEFNKMLTNDDDQYLSGIPIALINSFPANVLILYPVKTPENKVFWCFQGL